jgi:hypothetical protein
MSRHCIDFTSQKTRHYLLKTKAKVFYPSWNALLARRVDTATSCFAPSYLLFTPILFGIAHVN